MTRYIKYCIEGDYVTFTYADGSDERVFIHTQPSGRIFLELRDSSYIKFLPDSQSLRSRLVREIVGYEVSGYFPEIERQDLPLLLDSLLLGDNFGVREKTSDHTVENIQGVEIPIENIVFDLPNLCSVILSPPRNLESVNWSIDYYASCYIQKESSGTYLRLP